MELPSFRVITAPAVEPITLAEAQVHLRVDSSDEDDDIEARIIAARIQCENISHRAFVTQTLEVTLDQWPCGDVIQLPRPPLASITSITYIDSDGNSTVMSSSLYFADTASEPGRLALKYGQSWPTVTLRPYAGIAIRYVAGYGLAASVPENYKQAVKLMLGHLYENRESVVVAQGVNIQTLPMGLDALLLTDRGSW